MDKFVDSLRTYLFYHYPIAMTSSDTAYLSLTECVGEDSNYLVLSVFVHGDSL